MLSIKSILHPTDFSDRAAYAFQLASALARDHGSRLLICHVNQPPPPVVGEFGTAPPEPPDALEDLKEQLHAVRPADDTIPCEYYLLEGEPAEAIVDLARRTSCDLIALGTHGRRGLARLLMGSVAEQVVRTAPCPVLTVRTPLPAEAAATGAEHE